MVIHIINTGNELIDGRVCNTNGQWLCMQFKFNGYEVNKIICVSDKKSELSTAIHESIQEADVVILTGGLGPTDDDRTSQCLADALGVTLSQNKEVANHLKERFKDRKRPFSDVF